MRPRTIFNVVVGLVAIGAIVLVAAPKIGGDDDGQDNEPAAGSTTSEPPPPTTSEAERTAPSKPPKTPSPTRTVEERPKKPQVVTPRNPDDVKGSQEISLHRPANLRRALRVLERERRRAEGVFDGLRVAPGRIDTTINAPTKKIHLQIRPDFKIAFRSESPFPNQNDQRFRKKGLGAGAVDVRLPARILRRVDRQRAGSAARDLDYFVIGRDIIDFNVNYGAYLRTGPHPRIFLWEPDEPFRAIG